MITAGRLAMLAVFGYGAQAILTGVGPYENLKQHLAGALSMPLRCFCTVNNVASLVMHSAEALRTIC